MILVHFIDICILSFKAGAFFAFFRRFKLPLRMRQIKTCQNEQGHYLSFIMKKNDG